MGRGIPQRQCGVGDFELAPIEFGKAGHIDHLSDWQHCIGGLADADGAAAILKSQPLAHAVGSNAAMKVEHALGQRIPRQSSHLANGLNGNALGSRREDFDVRGARDQHPHAGHAAVDVTAQIRHGADADAGADCAVEIRQIR